MIRLFLLALFFFVFSFNTYSQSVDSLALLIKDIQRGENDSIRFAANKKFSADFEKLLLQKGSFNKNYDSLKNVSVLTSDDNKFRIYTWMVPHFDGNQYDYFGFVQLHSDTSDKLLSLKDSSRFILKPESEKLSNERWFGAVYYRIIPVKKSDGVYYTLLGWKGKDQIVTQKIIDVLFINKGKLKFGYPLFKTGSVYKNRIIFSFNSQATMTLHFDKNFNGIVFDHISSDKEAPVALSGPDGTYDAFKLKKGKWILSEDVDVRTRWSPDEKLPVPDEH